ncbi:MAG: sensor histidine kinase [Actinomycetota bacterium]
MTAMRRFVGVGAVALVGVAALAGTAAGAPAGPLPPITLPPPPVPLPVDPNALLDSVGDTAEQLVEVPLPGVTPAPAPVPAPAPATTPPAAPPAPVPADTGDAPADEPAAGSDGGPAAADEDTGTDADPVSLPARLGAAAGTGTNLLLLALGLGLALVAASPRGPTYRRARREVLDRLEDAYEQQHRAAAELAEADRLKGEFLSMISHELRTPLTSVKGFVDTVLLHWDRFSEEQRRELLDRASGRADELTRLIGQLLDFASIEADRVDVDLRALDVRERVDAVIGDVAPVVADHRIEVDVTEALVMTADADAFGHVLVNLLTNAVKFSPPGSTIRVEARAERLEVVVSVADQGTGISSEDQRRIFDRFYQSNSSGADGNGSRRGTGIGLAIARRFTEVQGGRIWVESEPGHGSTFFFTLPLSRTGVDRVVATSAPAPG